MSPLHTGTDKDTLVHTLSSSQAGPEITESISFNFTGRARTQPDFSIGFRLGRNLFETYTRLFVIFQAGQDFSHETFRHIYRRGHSRLNTQAGHDLTETVSLMTQARQDTWSLC